MKSTIPFNTGGKRRETGMEAIMQVLTCNFRFGSFIKVPYILGSHQPSDCPRLAKEQ